MGKHLRDKEKEINYLALCLQYVEKVPNVHFDFPNTHCNLAELKFDSAIDQVACFGFNVTSDTSPYIQSLEHYLQTGKTKQIDQQEWFNTEVAQELKSNLEQFIEFSKANASKKTISYVVAYADSEAAKQLPSLILHSSGVSRPFDPPGRPGTPEVSNVVAGSVNLKWAAPKHGGNVFSYHVVCRSTKASAAKEITTPGTSLTVSGLTPAVAYECQVFAVGDCDSIVASELCHFETLECTNEVTLAEKFLEHSQCLEPLAAVPIYELPLKLTVKDETNKLQKFEIILPNTLQDAKPDRILMVVGATGAGKSTLINGMANYILGVTWEDNFRYKVITDEGSHSQAFSQTKYISAYSFRSTNMDYNLTVVDTPGFGDTGGIENDRKIAEQIKQFFSGRRGTCSIDILHGIGFVTEAPLPRLTPTQHYIFTSILSIFGKNISDNIFFMTTFADANTPPVLEAVKQAKIPYRSSFKFNNSALYAANKSSQSFDSMFWQMGYTSFCDFFEHFSQAEANSLDLTREVLKKREKLETLIPKLQEQIRIGMSLLNDTKQEEAILKQHEADISANKDFEYTIEVPKFRKIDLKPGLYTTTCQICNFTCRNNCIYANNEERRKCPAMKRDYCTVCPKRCHWSQHSNVPYIIEYYQDMETRTSDDLKRRYDSAKRGKETAEAMIAENEDKLVAQHVEVNLLIEKAHKSISRLRQITLKPNPLTQVDYLDLLIETEKQEAKYGWQDRVKKLNEIRKYAELYQKVESGLFDSLGAIVQCDTRPTLLKRIQQYWKSQPEGRI